MFDVTHFGKKAAIPLYSADTTTVQGNLIFLSVGAGVQVLGVPASPSQNNVIMHNDVHTTNYGIADTGGIYLTSNSPGLRGGNEVTWNRVLHQLGADEVNGVLVSPSGALGIYLDNWESGDGVQGNIASGTSSAAFFVHCGSQNTVASNLFANGGQFEMLLTDLECGSTGNILFSNVAAITPENTQATNSLWGIALASGDDYPSAMASGGNYYYVPDPVGILTSDVSPSSSIRTWAAARPSMGSRAGRRSARTPTLRSVGTRRTSSATPRPT